MSHAAARIGDIAAEAGNDVHVQVENRLPGTLTHVHPDIETVWNREVLRQRCAAESLRVQRPWLRRARCVPEGSRRTSSPHAASEPARHVQLRPGARPISRPPPHCCEKPAVGRWRRTDTLRRSLSRPRAFRNHQLAFQSGVDAGSAAPTWYGAVRRPSRLADGAVVLVSCAGRTPTLHPIAHGATQTHANAWLEACCAHQRGPLGSMRAHVRSVQLERGNVGNLVAEHLVEQLWAPLQRPRVQAHHASCRHAASQ